MVGGGGSSRLGKEVSGMMTPYILEPCGEQEVKEGIIIGMMMMMMMYVRGIIMKKIKTSLVYHNPLG